jgi:PST family polysaccharide transporter
MVSIIAGLHWGATGVAAAYSVTDLCISTPLLFWYVGRRGPVRMIDFYHTIAPAFSASICSLGVLVITRPWLEPFSQYARLSIAAGLTIGVSLIVLGALPAGRCAIRNFKDMLLLLVTKQRNSIMTS